MRMMLTLVGGVILGASLSTLAVGQAAWMADAATVQAVSRVKEAIVEGHRKKDPTALDALYAADYTAISAGRDVRSKTDLLAGLATDPEMVEGRYELHAVRRWGSVAVASGHGRIVYRNADGSTRVSEYDSVNVFELRNGRWWYVAAFLP